MTQKNWSPQDCTANVVVRTGAFHGIWNPGWPFPGKPRLEKPFSPRFFATRSVETLLLPDSPWTGTTEKVLFWTQTGLKGPLPHSFVTGWLKQSRCWLLAPKLALSITTSATMGIQAIFYQKLSFLSKKKGHSHPEKSLFSPKGLFCTQRRTFLHQK